MRMNIVYRLRIDILKVLDDIRMLITTKRNHDNFFQGSQASEKAH